MRHKDIQIKNLRREANEAKVGSTEQYIRNELEHKIQEGIDLKKKLEEVKMEETRQEQALKDAKNNFEREKDEELEEKQ